MLRGNPGEMQHRLETFEQHMDICSRYFAMTGTLLHALLMQARGVSRSSASSIEL